MTSRPSKTLLVATGVVAASAIVFPKVRGYGTGLFQLVVLVAWRIVATITSDRYADSHHAPLWPVAWALNLLLFLLPAALLWALARKRWPILCTLATITWCAFYMASLFWLFPATDGP
jgi:hypothetical protein